MAVVEPAASGELLSERVAGGILPKVLNSFDMVAIFAAIVLFITNAAVIQSAGPTAFGWWILGFLAFLIPSAIVTGQLGVMFPGEGSIYLWTHKAFGAFWGFFAGFCAWWPGVLVMVATGTITLAFLGYVFPGTVGSWSIQAQGVLVILALLGVEVPLNMGVEIRNTRSITRYLFWGSLTVMAAYLIATWSVMVTVPAAGGRSAQVTAV